MTGSHVEEEKEVPKQKAGPKQDESEPVEEDMSFDNESLMHSQGSDAEQNRKEK